MFDPGNMKRLSPNTFDQNVRLKKPCVADISKPSNNPPGTHNWDQYKAEIGVEYALQTSSLIPQCPVAISNYHGIDNAASGMTDDQALPISTSRSDSTYLNAKTCLVSGDDMESLGGGSSLAGEEDAVPEFCFGVIVVTIKSTSRISDANGIALVDLQAFGDAVKITLQSSGKYAGLIRSPVIRQLLDDSTVELRTTCTESSPSSTQATGKSARTMLHDSTARIVISGAKQEKLRIGKILSDASLFLQHPYAEECGDQEYSNPHYLLRPGATMPKLQNAAGFGAIRTVKSGLLSEINKSRIIQIFDGSSLGSSQEICPQTFTSPRLKSELKYHQLQAIAVMVEREGGGVESCHFPSTWETTRFSDRAKRYRNTVTGVYSEYATPSMGGLLADDMGLGKTLSTLGLICLSTDSRTRGQDTAHTTLVVTTKSTLPGWQFQINQHAHNGQLRTALYHGPHRHSHAEYFDEEDLVLTTYETLRADYEAKGPLYENQWHRVVLDEAHHIRNRSSQIFLASCSIKSTFRWCLTGTPVHNSLDDYGALLSFLGVPSFTEKTMFDHWITKPIQQKKKEGFNRLQTLVRTTCLRRTKESLGDALSLPTRNEEIDFVSLHQQDQELYDFFKSRAAELALGSRVFNPATATLKSSQDGNILSLLNFLRLICDHGQQILPETALKIWNARDRTMSDRDEIMVNGDNDGSHILSAKVLALLKNLISMHTPTLDIQGQYVPVKSVVFSYWTKMLDLIQQALATYSFNTCRIDGSTSLEGRSIALKRFREDPECSVMLATIGSAGEGLDLTVTNHVHLIEPHWNPMAEAQAVDRVYRIGQQREVTVMRYIVPNSIETYIQWVQQQKLKIISQIVETQGTTQAEIDTERWKQLRDNLGCKTE